MNIPTKCTRYLLVAGLSALLSACSRAPVEDGKITVINDSQDSDFNILEVSGNGASFSLNPGEYAIMPSDTTTLYFSRQYKEYTRSYEVRCPHLEGGGIRMKLIDVHVNRISGGCKTVSANKY